MLLLLDNYDSFTYNLVQAVGQLGKRLKVFRNDRISIARIKRLRPSRIIISPGPGTPREGGISNAVVKSFAGKIPILGVCLGHQCIAYAFGARIVRARRLMHGKTSLIYHDGKAIYKRLPRPFTAARYHSLIVDEKTLPPEFEITARTRARELMGIRHRQLPGLEGIQFHPESFLTPVGLQMMRNFLRGVVFDKEFTKPGKISC